MTEPFDDEYGDRLRRALNTEAEAVTPSPDGLEQIRTKISKRQERRFGLWYASPWLRPLVAVAAAIFISTVAISASPALKNFVQTGHFSIPDGDGDSQSMNGDQSLNPSAPGGPGHPDSNTSPRLPTPHPTASDKHDAATCRPAGQLPQRDPEVVSATPTPLPTATCVPGDQTSTPPTSEGPTSSAPPTPSDEPTDVPTAPQPSVAPSP